MAIDWKLYERDVIRLYVNEKKTINETLKYLDEIYSVKISPKQFKSKFGGLKNLRADEWKVVIEELQKRQSRGKRSHVYLNNRKLDQGRITRETRRYSGNCKTKKLIEKDTSTDISVDLHTQNRIEIRTPSPRGTQSPMINSSRVRYILPENMINQQGHIAGSRTELLDSQLCLDQEFGLDLMDFDPNTIQVYNQAFTFNATENLSAILDMNGMPLCHSQQSLPNYYRYSPDPRDSSYLVSSPNFRNNMGWCRASSPLVCFSPEVFSFIPDIGASSSLLFLREACLSELAQSQARLSPGMHGWLNWQLIGVDSKLVVLKSTANFVEQVLWELNPDFEDHDFDQQSLHQIFSIVAYLISNNMLLENSIQNFFNWVLSEGLETQLLMIIQAKSISLSACIEKILVAVTEPGKLSHSRVHHVLDLFMSTHNLNLSNRLKGRLLYSLANSSNIDAAKLLISYGADVNFVHKSASFQGNYGTPLIKAIWYGELSMMEYFISVGSDIKKRVSVTSSRTVQTALIIAIRSQRFSAAKALLDRGAEVDMDLRIDGLNILELAKASLPTIYPMLLARLTPENTPQIYQMVDAAEKGNRTLSQFLFKNNIVQEAALEHALCYAIKMESQGAVRTLLNRGVDPDARRYRLIHHNYGDTNVLEDNLPIILAAASLDQTSAQSLVYLLMKADADLNDDVLTKICDVSAAKDDIDVLLVLAQAGLNITLLGPPILETLALGVDIGIHELGYYLDMGTPINAYGPQGQNSLQAAAASGNLLLTQYLFDRGADINLLPMDDGGRTALQAAVERGYLDIMDYLIDAGADVKAPPAKRNGVTVLEAAAKARSCSRELKVDILDQENEITSAFKHLLALGALVNRADGSSSDVLHMLISSRRNESLKLAIQAGARIEDRETSRGAKTPLQVAAESNMEAVQLLLDLNVDINAPPGDEYGRTALQAATSAPNPDVRIVEFLISRGADVNAKPATKGGLTALQGAAIHGDIPIVRMLLMYGADINAAPALEEGRTSIEGAAEHGRLDMIQLLLASGAKPDPIMGFSRAIELAEENEHFVHADLLREHEKGFPTVLTGLEDSLFGLHSLSIPSQGMVFPDDGF